MAVAVAVAGEGFSSCADLFALGAVALAMLPGAVNAQAKLEARYTVTLAGIPLGSPEAG